MFKIQNSNKRTKTGFRNKESGIGLLEAIIAMGVFTIVMAAVVLMYINVTVGSLLALEKTKAIFLAQEGLEATRSIGFHNFYDLIPGTHGLGIINDRWQTTGTSDITADDRFTRTITITSPDPVPYGLVGHWTFNDIRGCALRDISGEKNHGFLRPVCPANSPTWGLDRHNRANRALSFDGVDDYIDVGNDTSLNPQHITTQFWALLNTFETRPHLVGKGGGGTGVFFFVIETTGEIRVFMDFGAGWRVVSAGAFRIPIGVWHHFAMTYNGTIARLYIDGVERGTRAEIGTLRTTDTHRLMFGRRSDTMAGLVNGFIDEVRIYNRALTAAEIRTLYNHGRQRIENRLEKNIESRLIESRVEWNSPLLGIREVVLQKEIVRQ